MPISKRFLRLKKCYLYQAKREIICRNSFPEKLNKFWQTRFRHNIFIPYHMKNKTTYYIAAKRFIKNNLITSGLLLSGLFIFFIVLIFNPFTHSKKITATPISISAHEQSLIEQAYNHLYFGKKISEEAMIRSSAYGTTQLAGKIFKGHSDKLVGLINLADKKNITILPELTNDQLIKWKKLVKEKGRSFDGMYVNLLWQEYEKGNELFRLMSVETDPEILDFSKKLTNQSMFNLAELEETKLEIEFISTRTNVVYKSEN